MNNLLKWIKIIRFSNWTIKSAAPIWVSTLAVFIYAGLGSLLFWVCHRRVEFTPIMCIFAFPISLSIAICLCLFNIYIFNLDDEGKRILLFKPTLSASGNEADCWGIYVRRYKQLNQSNSLLTITSVTFLFYTLFFNL